jgi:Phage gp6-like head-tail connector protein
MTIIDLSPPLAEPLTLAEVRMHLRLDADDEDDLLVALITVAREHLERETGLVRQVTDVTVYDGDGVGQAVDLDGHLLDGEARPARLWLRAVPQPGRVLNGIEVEFSAGFGESGADVPDTLKRAMLLHIAAMFACRGVVAPEAQPAVVPPRYDRLIAPFCRRGL